MSTKCILDGSLFHCFLASEISLSKLTDTSRKENLTLKLAEICAFSSDKVRKERRNFRVGSLEALM